MAIYPFQASAQGVVPQSFPGAEEAPELPAREEAPSLSMKDAAKFMAASALPLPWTIPALFHQASSSAAEIPARQDRAFLDYQDDLRRKIRGFAGLQEAWVGAASEIAQSRLTIHRMGNQPRRNVVDRTWSEMKSNALTFGILTGAFGAAYYILQKFFSNNSPEYFLQRDNFHQKLKQTLKDHCTGDIGNHYHLKLRAYDLILVGAFMGLGTLLSKIYDLTDGKEYRTPQELLNDPELARMEREIKEMFDYINGMIHEVHNAKTTAQLDKINKKIGDWNHKASLAYAGAQEESSLLKSRVSLLTIGETPPPPEGLEHLTLNHPLVQDQMKIIEARGGIEPEPEAHDGVSFSTALAFGALVLFLATRLEPKIARFRKGMSKIELEARREVISTALAKAEVNCEEEGRKKLRALAIAHGVPVEGELEEEGAEEGDLEGEADETPAVGRVSESARIAQPFVFPNLRKAANEGGFDDAQRIYSEALAALSQKGAESLDEGARGKALADITALEKMWDAFTEEYRRTRDGIPADGPSITSATTPRLRAPMVLDLTEAAIRRETIAEFLKLTGTRIHGRDEERALDLLNVIETASVEAKAACYEELKRQLKIADGFWLGKYLENSKSLQGYKATNLWKAVISRGINHTFVQRRALDMVDDLLTPEVLADEITYIAQTGTNEETLPRLLRIAQRLNWSDQVVEALADKMDPADLPKHLTEFGNSNKKSAVASLLNRNGSESAELALNILNGVRYDEAALDAYVERPSMKEYEARHPLPRDSLGEAKVVLFMGAGLLAGGAPSIVRFMFARTAAPLTGGELTLIPLAEAAAPAAEAALPLARVLPFVRPVPPLPAASGIKKVAAAVAAGLLPASLVAED